MKERKNKSPTTRSINHLRTTKSYYFPIRKTQSFFLSNSLQKSNAFFIILFGADPDQIIQTLHRKIKRGTVWVFVSEDGIILALVQSRSLS
ncbi:hypothetical protein V6N13_088754 [Hibiscus sabdariffa]|uniref:Uncharacterized protein n=1 Tax=Hibiscus sabdariffa TaxID=183260 RepID=A0ABR2G0A4_9ROSI